jgi:hypothetical protein
MISVLVAATGDTTLAVGVTVVATLVVVALVAALVSVVKAARALRAAAEELAARSGDLLDQLGGTLAQADAELARVDDLVGSAEDLTETVGTASRAAYVTLASPVIKVMAFRRGSARAMRRWRARGSIPATHPARVAPTSRSSLPVPPRRTHSAPSQPRPRG